MIPSPLAVLKEEHHGIAKLLDLLDRQLVLIENERHPDYELLVEIADYFRTFPDMFHHPKEDLVLRHLARRQPEVAADLMGLEAEHEEGAQVLVRFSRTLVEFLLEPDLARDKFLAAARSFLANERRHMAWEEERFFSAAQDWLDRSDWEQIGEKFQRLKDPSFEREAQFRFVRVNRELSSWRKGFDS